MLSEKTLKTIRLTKAKRILLQIPEGLKMKAQSIAAEIKGIDVIISCDPCFGACDIRVDEAKRLECDLILHIGHSTLGVKNSVPVIYEHWEMKVNLKLFKEIKIVEKTIGLVTSVQYAGYINDVKKTVEKKGHKVLIGKNKTSGIQGQILGCEHTAALSIEKDVEAFLFYGTGKFHPLGLAGVVRKPVYYLNLETGKIEVMNTNKEIIKKELRLEKARECKNFAVLMSTKPGQSNPSVALKVKERLENKDKQVWLVSMDRFTPEGLMGIDVDCYVNTACPRITEDSKLFGKLIIDAKDVESI